MTVPLLTGPDQKEGVSLAYVRALAARAGFSTSVPEPDRDSVDLRIMAHRLRRPALDLQLKARNDLPHGRSGLLPFRLSVKNYGDLCVETQTPRLLVLLELPKDESRWMTVTHEELILRRRAYWLSLQLGHQGPTDQQTVTVYVPEANVFNVEALRKLMEQSRRGEI